MQVTNLFYTLPDTLPFNTAGHFSCETDDIEDLGYAGALNNAFHSAWGYKAQGLVILERGGKLDSTLAIVNHALNHPGCDFGVVENWVDALISAALSATSLKRYISSVKCLFPSILLTRIFLTR